MEKEKLNQLSSIKKVIAVMSGKGGVGKSTVSALLAVSLRRLGYQVGLMDADITGPSIPKMFGLSGKPQQSELGLFPLQSKSGIRIISVNLLLEHEDDPVIWRGPLMGGTVRQFWSDVVWHELDFLVLDFPPGTGDVPLTVMQSIPVDGTILVSSPQDLVYMEVKKSLKMAQMLEIPVLGLVENMSYLLCPHCDQKIELFGTGKGEQLAKEVGIEFLKRFPLNPDLANLADQGLIEDYQQIDEDWTQKIIARLASTAQKED